MIAVEFVDTPGIATAVSQAALKHELMLLTAVGRAFCYVASISVFVSDSSLSYAFRARSK